jgi:hypothetical protein
MTLAHLAEPCASWVGRTRDLPFFRSPSLLGIGEPADAIVRGETGSACSADRLTGSSLTYSSSHWTGGK